MQAHPKGIQDIDLVDRTSPILERNHLAAARRAILAGIFTIGLLLAYGLLRFPGVLAASPSGGRSLTGVLIVLVIYAMAGWAGPAFAGRVDPRILPAANRFGLLAGAVFAAEILLEYYLLPADNSVMGLVEYGLVLVLFFLAGLWVAWRTQAFRNGVMAAVWSALVSFLIWYVVVLLVFYLFFGTPQQAQVFLAEGNYADFARSGLGDFNAFVMEDFMGAGFYHALLLPGAAVIFGTFGAAVGKALARLRKK